MNIFKKTNLLMVSALLTASLVACGEDENGLDPYATDITEDDYKYVGQAIGNFKAEEWYPGGELGTTENTTASCYEDETEAIANADLLSAFKRGEMLFEHDFTQTSTASFGGLGPAYVRSSCIHCHPGYGHGKRVNSYQADQRGNGYLLVVYHPADGVNSDDGPYIAEVTGMPQSSADFYTAQFGKHQVQDQQIRICLQGGIQPAPSVKSRVHLISLMLQLKFEKTGDFLFVFNDEYSGHRIIPLSFLCNTPAKRYPVPDTVLFC